MTTAKKPNRSPKRRTTKAKTDSTSSEFQPGDIWLHQGLGRLAVTDEEPDRYPGLLKCYWMMGGNPKPPYTFMHPRNTKHFTLISRINP